MHGLMADLFPICRSITGAGLRETLARIGKIVRSRSRGADRHPGLRLDHPARVEHPRRLDGRCRRASGWSTSGAQPARRRTTAARVARRSPSTSCDPHLHTLPDHPDLGPVPDVLLRASDWGFCLSQDSLDAAARRRVRGGDRRHARGRQPDLRRVRPPGRVDRGGPDLEPRLPPLARQRQPLRRRRRRLPRTRARREPSGGYTYRFLFAPGHDRRDRLAGPQRGRALGRIRPGSSLACVGDAGPGGLQAQPARRRRRSTAPRRTSSRHAAGATRSSTSRPTATTSGSSARRGSTYRSARSPDRVTIARPAPHVGGRLGVDRPGALADTLGTCLSILAVLEDDATLISRNPKGEPQLGRRGLYRSFGGRAEQADLESALLWVMSMADGAAHDARRRRTVWPSVREWCTKPRRRFSRRRTWCSEKQSGEQRSTTS